MPTKPKKKQTFTEQARRKQILDVAYQLFIDNGYEATSLDEIAKIVSVSRGVIFYYFDGKREIGEHVLLQSLRNYSSYVQKRVNQKDSATNQLLEFSDACLDYLNDNLEDYLLFLDLIGCFGNTKQKHKISVSANRNTREWLIEIIRQGQKNKQIKKMPANVLADVIQGVVDGIVSLSALEPETVNIKGCKKLTREMISKVIQV